MDNVNELAAKLDEANSRVWELKEDMKRIASWMENESRENEARDAILALVSSDNPAECSHHDTLQLVQTGVAIRGWWCRRCGALSIEDGVWVLPDHTMPE